MRGSIRIARADDAQAVGDVFLASRRELLPFAPLRHAEHEIRQWIEQVLIPGGGVFVSVDDDHGRITAMLALARDAHGVGWIDQLYVAPARVRQGIGARLLTHAKAELGPPIRLYTFQENRPARHFYERHGFTAIAFGDGSGNEEGVADVLYEWTEGSA